MAEPAETNRPTDTTMPEGVPVFDTMLGVPSNRESWHKDFGSLVRDRGSQDLRHAAGYMFKDLPEVEAEVDYVDWLIEQMDQHGVRWGLLPVAFGDEYGSRAVAAHPDRLFGCYLADPNRGVEELTNLRRAVRELGAIAAACFPCGTQPQVPINEPQMYPLYATCVELDIPMFINVGVPGPRFPMHPQHAEHLDEVCYDFPDLVLVTRHGGEPWCDLLVKLMLKWPGLHYSTSAFAPRYYPEAIIDYANTRGADKVLYAGYFPMGLSLDRIFSEMPRVPLREHVWPKFLHENAKRILKVS